MSKEKLTTFTVSYGGDTIISTHLGDTLEQLLGTSDLQNILPNYGEDMDEITIVIGRKYTREELDEFPEFQ